MTFHPAELLKGLGIASIFLVCAGVTARLKVISARGVTFRREEQPGVFKFLAGLWILVAAISAFAGLYEAIGWPQP